MPDQRALKGDLLLDISISQIKLKVNNGLFCMQTLDLGIQSGTIEGAPKKYK